MAESKVSTYVTGFCGVKNHSRCPAIVKNNVGGQVWTCTCTCHEADWELEAARDAEAKAWAAGESPMSLAITLPVEAASAEAWALIFGCDPDLMRVVWGLREVLTKMDLEA